VHVHLITYVGRPVLALLGFAAWAIVLVLGVGLVRVTQVLLGRAPANGFPSGTPHGSDAYWRLNRAHINAVENLPIFASIVLGGAALGVSSERLCVLAEATLALRVAQSIFHVASGRSTGVGLRFTAYVGQLACFVWMIVETLRLATS
jgi:uncharacterized MAPEG superfamily protein